MKNKKHFYYLLSLCFVLSCTPVSDQKVNADNFTNQFGSSDSIDLQSKVIYHIVYYPYSIYNMNINSKKFKPIPNTYYYNNGSSQGILYLQSWESGPNAYKATYKGYVGSQYPIPARDKEIKERG